MNKTRKNTIQVQGTAITVLSTKDTDYISLTDMLKAKDGDFFITDWLRNRNTVEFLGIWESINNPDFNYGEFAIIRSQAGLNNYKVSVKEWVESLNAEFIHMNLPQRDRLARLNQTAIRQIQTLTQARATLRLEDGVT